MIVYLFLILLAGHRIVVMLHTETGPLNIFEKLRSFIYDTVFKLGELDVNRWYWLYRIGMNVESGFDCWRCLSVWVYGVLTIILMFIFPITIFEAILIWLGVSGVYLVIRMKGWLYDTDSSD